MDIRKHFDVRVNAEQRAKLAFLQQDFQKNSIGKIHYTDVFRIALEKLYDEKINDKVKVKK